MTTARANRALVAVGRAMATAAVLVVALVLCLVCSDHGHTGAGEPSASSSVSQPSPSPDDGCTSEPDCPTVSTRTAAAATQIAPPADAPGSGPVHTPNLNATAPTAEEHGLKLATDRSRLGVWRI